MGLGPFPVWRQETQCDVRWPAVLYVVRSCVVGWVVVVVVMGVRGACWLLESAVYKVAFHRVSFRAILCRNEPGHVAREIVVGSGWLEVRCEVAFPSLGPSSLLLVPFLLG